MGFFVELKLLEQCKGLLFLQKFQVCFCGERFEVPHTPAYVVALGHEMDMVFQYHIGIECQTLLNLDPIVLDGIACLRSIPC